MSWLGILISIVFISLGLWGTIGQIRWDNKYDDKYCSAPFAWTGLFFYWIILSVILGICQAPTYVGILALVGLGTMIYGVAREG